MAKIDDSSIIWDDDGSATVNVPEVVTTAKRLPNPDEVVWDEPDSVGSRLLTGVMDPIVGAGQIMDKVLVDPIRQQIFPGATNMQEVVDQREAEYQAPEGVDWARIGGNVANPVSWVGPTKAGSVLTQTMARRGALTGAGQSALGPTTGNEFFSDKVKQAAAGAVLGATLGKLLGGIVEPTAPARELMDRGVTLTPGQAAGAGSITKRLEDAMGSNVVAGAPVRNAQRRAVQEANVAAAQSVADTAGHTGRLTMPPVEAIEQTRDIIGKTYDAALNGVSVPAFATEGSMLTRLGTLADDYPMLADTELAKMQKYINVRMQNAGKNNNGVLTGDMLKTMDAEIGKYIRDLPDRTAAPAWRELQQTLREVIEFGQSDPAKAEMLKKANAAYRQLLAIENARLAGNEHFTPKQLARQVEKRELQQTDLGKVSQSMSATLPNVVNDSGTAERLMTNLLPSMLIGGGAGANELGYGTVGTGLMAAGLMASRPGIRMMTGNTAPQKLLAPYSSNLVGVVTAALRNRERK